MLGGDTDLAVVFSYVVTTHYIFHSIYYSKWQSKDGISGREKDSGGKVKFQRIYDDILFSAFFK